MASIYIEVLNNNQGEWLDNSDLDADAIREEIDRVVRENFGEEWIIAAYEDCAGYSGGDVEELAAIVEAISNHDESTVKAYLQCISGNLVEELENLEDRLVGHWEDEKDFAENSYIFEHIQQASEEIKMPWGVTLASYIDWEHIGKEAFLAGGLDSVRIDGRMYVFQDC
jgi:antirestriction protein